MKKAILIASAVAVIAPLAAASAHHSFAMFDQTKQVPITGTVKEFQWTNPHSWIQLEAPKDGKNVVYSIEGGSPNGLRRQGWSSTTFKPGDKVTVYMSPLKNGDAGGSFVGAVLANGNKLGRVPQ